MIGWPLTIHIHVPTTYQLHTNCILTTYHPHINYNHILTTYHYIPTTYQLHIKYIPTPYQPHTDHVSTTYQPHTDCILTTYQLHANHMPTTYQPHYQPHINYIPTTYQLHTNHIPTTYQPHQLHTNHISTYQPHINYVPTTYWLHSDHINYMYLYQLCANHITNHISTTYLYINFILTTYPPHSIPTTYNKTQQQLPSPASHGSYSEHKALTSVPTPETAVQGWSINALSVFPGFLLVKMIWCMKITNIILTWGAFHFIKTGKLRNSIQLKKFVNWFPNAI